ncbi:MAG TPA: HlyD family efflux transporter periplasmic adaptor subunit, partial [Bacteroidales bacterium]|nr:HlyD family efflux transporter periplasmic adaptor subunit [Bacteroidales bacterium]
MDRIIQKKKWTAKKIAAYTGIAAFAFFIIYLLFLRDNTSRLYIDPSRLTIAEVRHEPFQEFIPVDGVVQPIRTVFIDAVQGGRVEAIYVNDGAVLKAGDSILRLSNPNMELDYMNRETQMYEVINNLQNTKLNMEQRKFTLERQILDINYQIDKARLDFERKTKLFRDKLISLQDFEDAERNYNYLMGQFDIALRTQRHDSVYTVTQLGQIRASLDRMNMNLAMLRENLEHLCIKAPISGRLTSFMAEIGETKTPGQTIAHIDVLEGFKLRARIDERYINRTFIGQEAEFDYAGQNYQLEIDRIYSNVQAGAFEVDLLFADKVPEGIRRGQTLQLRLKFSGTTLATTVRRGGFYQETGGNWIYVLEPNGQFAERRPIRIGRQNI